MVLLCSFLFVRRAGRKDGEHMVIDMHFHPAFYEDICTDAERLRRRCDEMGYHLMNPAPLTNLDRQNAHAGIDKVVILPLDHSTRCGGEVVLSNEEMLTLQRLRPDTFIPFASVDPHRPDAAAVLERAFGEQHMAGLKLNPAKQRFDPADRKLWPLYELCVGYNKPILFHAGLSWEPDTLTRYAHPLAFEEVALTFPTLRFCLAHMGWPWVQETCMLLIKYENVYADTAMGYLDSPREFFQKVFRQDMGEHWLEHNFAQKVMFGSNAPRFRPVVVKQALEALPLRPRTRQLLLGGNALRFLGGEDAK